MTSISDANQEPEKAEIVYKTKIIHFLGRSVPIILQNDNGPCPLLAICNVLLLRNNLSLGLDIPEVASSRLLALVAERLIDSNSNVQGKTEEYAQNQQQNISDALALLHHLVTGLDVNVRFRNTHDFEFTPECAVFDLLDIGLVHGWLCDPQDKVTAKILEPHSYNTLVEKLVQLQAMKTDLQQAVTSEDTVDFAAATTATLGVPSPSRAVLLKTKSFEDQNANGVADGSPKSGTLENKTAHLQRKGDAEENAQLLEALQLSSLDVVSDDAKKTYLEDSEDILISGAESENARPRNHEEVSCSFSQDIYFQTLQGAPTVTDSNICKEPDSTGEHGRVFSADRLNHEGCDEREVNKLPPQDSPPSSLFPAFDNDVLTSFPAEDQANTLDFQLRASTNGSAADLSREEDPVQFEVAHQNSSAIEPDLVSLQDSECMSRPMVFNVDLDASPSTFSANSEPLYEGEAEISGGASAFETREPLYEGEANLADCTGQITVDEEGAIISSFLKSNATQLTYYGLFCLQEDLKERELCVFFRNNHFSTMFKYNGDLYLLVTDQGYLTQPDIAWEKLDEVHGDTVFVTGTFAAFQPGENSGMWDEQGAIAATADYLSSHQQASKKAVELGGNNHTDFDLAVILQQEEFEQQQQQQQNTRIAPASARQPQMSSDLTMRADSSRLITGPKKSSYLYKPESKSKCVIM